MAGVYIFKPVKESTKRKKCYALSYIYSICDDSTKRFKSIWKNGPVD